MFHSVQLPVLRRDACAGADHALTLDRRLRRVRLAAPPAAHAPLIRDDDQLPSVLTKPLRRAAPGHPETDLTELLAPMLVVRIRLHAIGPRRRALDAFAIPLVAPRALALLLVVGLARLVESDLAHRVIEHYLAEIPDASDAPARAKASWALGVALVLIFAH